MLKKILDNLKTGNYRVEYRERCDCRFDWYLNGKLDCVITSANGECWIDNILIMDDLAGKRIATYSAYFGLTVQIADAEQEIVNAIKNSDAYQKLTAGIDSPNARNDLHDRRKRESLVKWLEENAHLSLYVRFENANDDSASEYTCIMLAMPPKLYDPDKLHVPRNWYAHSPEEWAEMYLRKDDAVTVRFLLEEEIYSICHCQYVEKYDAIVPSDMGEEFYAPLEYAYEAIEKLWPKGNDCYKLARYCINEDNGDIELKEDITAKWSPSIIFDRFKKVYPEVYRVDGGSREVELVLTNEPRLSFEGCYKSSATDRGGNRWLVKWEKETDWRHETPSYAELIEVRYYKYTEDLF